MPLKFRNGTNTIVYGLTGSGKSTFIQEVIKKRMVTDFPRKVFYFYNLRQPFMDNWDDSTPVEFVEGLQLERVYEYGGNCVTIIDDLALHSQKKTADLFLVGSHHLQTTVFYLTQTLFPRDEYARMMVQNAHYLVLFGDMRSQRQINTLSHQIFTSEERCRLINAFTKAINTPFEFVLLTFVQGIPRQLTVICDYWSDNPTVFL